MYIFKVKVTKLQGGYLIVKLIEGKDINKIDHLSFIQLIIDQNGEENGQYIQTIQIFFPGQQQKGIDAQKQIFEQLAPKLKGCKVTQCINFKRLYQSPLMRIVEQQISKRYKQVFK